MGASRRGLGCELFKNFIYKFSLRDMCFSSPLFTWNKGMLFQKLNRAIYNSMWEIATLNYSVRHLHRLKSDYWPILIASSLKFSNSNQ